MVKGEASLMDSKKISWHEKVYALYKGDQFITDGTIHEIHKATGKTITYLRWMTYPYYRNVRGTGPNRLQLVSLDDEEGE
jgi:hypothetical protein